MIGQQHAVYSIFSSRHADSNNLIYVPFVKLDYLVGYALLMIRAAYTMDQRG